MLAVIINYLVNLQIVTLLPVKETVNIKLAYKMLDIKTLINIVDGWLFK